MTNTNPFTNNSPNGLFNNQNSTQPNQNIFSQTNNLNKPNLLNQTIGGTSFHQGQNIGGQGNNLFTNQNNIPGQPNNMFNNPINNMGYTGNNTINNPMANPIDNPIGCMIGGLMGNIGQAPGNRIGPSPSQIEQIKNQIEECNRRLSLKNIQLLRINDCNMYRNQKVNKLPELKPQVMTIMSNFKDLRTYVNKIKQQGNDLELKASQYSKSVHKKLKLYKECLIQNISQQNMANEIKKQLQLMEKQINDFFRPLYNAYQSKKLVQFEDPDTFCLQIAKEILRRMNVLHEKVQDLLSCRGVTDSNDEQVYDTVGVFEQLIEYYQNVSVKVREFTINYNSLKKNIIERRCKSSSQETLTRIENKSSMAVDAEFRIYDLVKQIDGIIQRRDKKEEQRRNKSLQYK